ncbi:acyl-CoA thioesterase II [Microbacterium horticulturae]|uniref:Acyl-CoA thioesterase II n=1 Tax=Microbacterium horticulturae TaxID=3028316 RepID=A0ABY8C5D5_9MICO|nr:acyl-CoA thioesterase II [Microbacterium sp. KACC 23027]WEG10291.1 acyl-CoA thioesterase II [Microbacterium sp. KACC 23027]
MTDAAAAPTDPVAALLEVLDLAASDARTTEDIFVGASQPMPHGRVYGGQVVAQSIVAAQRTVDADRSAHSLHGYFLRPGDAAKPITFSVDRIHDGRSFSTRRTQAYQNGVPIFSMIASFEVESPGLDHQAPMPEGLPEPEDLPSEPSTSEAVVSLDRSDTWDRPVEHRHIPVEAYGAAADGPLLRHAVWMRVPRALPDDPALHRAALVYMTDMSIQETVLRAHDVTWATPGLKLASLDHAMWWHRDGRADEWMLYVQESPSARGGRGLTQGRIYSRDGVLLASVAQEVMVRVPR